MTHASLFSGIGGAEVAATMMGWENIFHCEINPFCRRVLEYWYPNSKSYEDITKTNFEEWRGKVDVLTGGFPCQPFSYAGQRRGANDDRYLWPHMLRAIQECRPTWVIGENVAGISTMVEQSEIVEVGVQTSLFGEEDTLRSYELRQRFTLERVCADLESIGYSVQPIVIPACAVGAPHRRDRIFILAQDTMRMGCQRRDGIGQHSTLFGNIGTTSHDGQVGRTSADTPVNGLQHGHLAGSKGGQVGEVCGERDSSERNIPTAADGCGRVIADTDITRPRTSRQGGGVEAQRSDIDAESSQRSAETQRTDGLSQLQRTASDMQSQSGESAIEREDGSSKQEQPRRRSGQDARQVASDSRCLHVEGCGHERSHRADGADSSNQPCALHSIADSSKSNRGGQNYESGKRWEHFPTVSPIHRGNDGIPIRLDNLSIPFTKWRIESLKAYGNAIVPQVMYRIFQSIEEAEENGRG